MLEVKCHQAIYTQCHCFFKFVFTIVIYYIYYSPENDLLGRLTEECRGVLVQYTAN